MLLRCFPSTRSLIAICVLALSGATASGIALATPSAETVGNFSYGELLSGTVPFLHENFLELIDKIRSEDPRPPLTPASSSSRSRRSSRRPLVAIRLPASGRTKRSWAKRSANSTRRT